MSFVAMAADFNAARTAFADFEAEANASLLVFATTETEA
jgi:hypothetical protein